MDSLCLWEWLVATLAAGRGWPQEGASGRGQAGFLQGGVAEPCAGTG